jgi:ABC-type antimicrobial peptide transport system permease subunit
MSYAVAQRSREVGIRIALGATPGSVLSMVLGQGLRLAVFGTACGLAGALLLARLFAGLLYGVAARDPFTFVAVPVILLAIGALASYFPARRAAVIDPVSTLRAP